MALRPKARETNKQNKNFYNTELRFSLALTDIASKIKINPQNSSNKPKSNKNASHIAQLSKLITKAILTTPLKLVNLT